MDNYRVEGFKSYRKQLEQVRGGGGESVLHKDCSYEDALKEVKRFIQEKKLQNDDVGVTGKNTKEYLARKQAKYKEYIKSAMAELRLRVDDYTEEDFLRDALSDIAGYSVLDEAFLDDEITDIFVNSDKEIFVEKNGKNVRYWKTFRSEEQYLETVERFLNESGKELNGGDKKIVHSELFGDRGCTIHKSISTKQASMTYRKHGYTNVTRDDLIERKVMTEEMADFLGTVMRGELNMIVSGLTGSGKTTTLQSLINYYINDKRILIAEDTQELEVTNENTLQLVSFRGKTEAETVGLEDLIHTALRLKPRVILIGEIRQGAESIAAIEAAETGHSTLFTMHGGQPVNVLNRLVTKFLTAMPSLGISAVERIIGNAIDYICVQDAIPNVGRKVTEICEVGYDFENKVVTFKTIYKFDFETGEFIKVNNISPDKVNTMYRRGLKKEDVLRWID